MLLTDYSLENTALPCIIINQKLLFRKSASLITATGRLIIMKRVGDLLLLLTLVGVALSDQSESIIELTDKNIGSLLNQSIHAVVEFYAPWCGYCQEFAPIYEEAAKRIRKMNDTILVAKINADQFEEAAEQYDIEGLPTIKWFANGVDKYEYAGQPSMYVDYFFMFFKYLNYIMFFFNPERIL